MTTKSLAIIMAGRNSRSRNLGTHSSLADDNENGTTICHRLRAVPLRAMFAFEQSTLSESAGTERAGNFDNNSSPKHFALLLWSGSHDIANQK